MFDAQVRAFAAALRQGDVARAADLVRRMPAMRAASIHVAAAAGDEVAVRTLLAADPASARQRLAPYGLEPLLFAVEEDLKRALGVPASAHLATVRALLDAGADPNAAAPLPDVADAIPALYFPCVAGNVAVARLLLERGAQPTDGESLYHAAEHDHRDVCALLVEFGADLHRGPAALGNTPLHFLAAHTPGNPITPRAMRGMAWLVEHGADPAIASFAGVDGHRHGGETPLHRAAAVGHDASVLRMLVAHGAPLEATRDDGATAYQVAVRTGHTDAAAALASLGARTTLAPLDALLAACHRGDEASARALLHEQPDMLASIPAGDRDALVLAVAADRRDAVRALCAVGWPQQFEGEWGGTPLHHAAWNANRELVQVLLTHGAPVNARDSRYGSSAVGWAAHGSAFSPTANDTDYPAVMQLLLDAGATYEAAVNQWDEPPETLARPSVVAVMRERGFLPD